jgi:hypothetical protein
MADTTPAISFEQLVELREKSEAISGFLHKRLKQHLATLYPLLAPRRVFGKYVGSKEPVARVDEAYAQLLEKYKSAAGAPFDLHGELDEASLSSVENGIEIYPWEYSYQAGGKTLTITNPFRWAVSFKSDYSLSELRGIYQTRKGDARTPSVRQFVVNAVALQVVLNRMPGVAQLLQDLRYTIEYETHEGLGKLPLVTLSSGLASYRPPDDLMLMATRFSGVPAFIELIDADAVKRLDDPLRSHIESLLI